MPRVHSRLTGDFAVVAHAFGRFRSPQHRKGQERFVLRQRMRMPPAPLPKMRVLRNAGRRKVTSQAPLQTMLKRETRRRALQLPKPKQQRRNRRKRRRSRSCKAPRISSRSCRRTFRSAGRTRRNPSGPTVAELQAQLDEARRELDNAEREKVFVSEKTHGDREASSAPRPTTQERVTRRRSSPPGLHGTILAVNQAYNFVVLNLGGRQGVQTNAELLVMRGGTLIGKIRVSSVEPATAIGDIISSSLPRGVQVQPGDTVVYVGTDS